MTGMKGRSPRGFEEISRSNALIPDDPQERQIILNAFDDALRRHPTLASIFNEKWRAQYRGEFLNAPRQDLFMIPAYAAPWLDTKGDVPSGFQARLEDGARFIAAVATKRHKNDVFSRLRGDGHSCTSGEEELLLGAGLVAEFGEESVEPYAIVGGTSSLDFRVRADGKIMLIEATGRVQPSVRAGVREFGGRKELLRRDGLSMRKAFLEKAGQREVNDALVIVGSEYSVEPSLEPSDLRSLISGNLGQIPLLGVAYVYQYRVHGIEFRQECAKRFGVDSVLLERLHRAINGGFFPS